MFRLIFGSNDWKWTAFGKHPSASEYLRPKSGSPLQMAVSAWMEQGFEMLPEELKSVGGLSWSFWMKGPNKKIICGRLSSSCDRFGRVYPLLMVGEGVGGDTANNWDLLPVACKESWDMLHVSALEHIDEKTPLENSLKKVPAPNVDWAKYKERRSELEMSKVITGSVSTSKFMQKMHNVDELSRRPVFSLPFDEEHAENYSLPSYKFLALLKSRIQVEPYMVFLGGSQDCKSLTVLKFPPRAQDFVRLWESNERGSHGL